MLSLTDIFMWRLVRGNLHYFWHLGIWMPRNIAIPMFGFIGNLLRFLGM